MYCQAKNGEKYIYNISINEVLSQTNYLEDVSSLNSMDINNAIVEGYSKND